jgi:hypothetical protein
LTAPNRWIIALPPSRRLTAATVGKADNKAVECCIDIHFASADQLEARRRTRKPSQFGIDLADLDHRLDEREGVHRCTSAPAYVAAIADARITIVVGAPYLAATLSIKCAVN